MDLLNTNVNSVKYMPASNAHTLMHVHTLTLSHTCAHKAHTHVHTCAAFCNAPFLPTRQENLTNPAAYVRSTVVTAFKYTITDQPQLIDVLLKACIGDFLETLRDPELVGTSSDVKMCESHFLFLCVDFLFWMLFLYILYMCICLDFVISGLYFVPFVGCVLVSLSRCVLPFLLRVQGEWPLCHLTLLFTTSQSSLQTSWTASCPSCTGRPKSV